MEKTGDSNALKRHLSFEKDSLTGRVRCFELNNGIRGKELAERLNFAESEWRADWSKCLSAESLPLIFVPVQPQAMPPELIPLAPDAMIVLRNETSTYDVLKRVEGARAVINAAIERNRLGRFTVWEVAFLLARANKSHPLAMHERLVKGFLNSDFSCRDTFDNFPIGVSEKLEWLKKTGLNNPKYLIHDDWAFTTATQVNKWLDKIDDEAILPRLQNASPATTPPALPVVADSASETKEQRQDRRLKACIDAGLPMDTKDALSRLPDGVGDVAGSESVTRQAFSTDVKAALKRRESTKREGSTVHRV